MQPSPCPPFCRLKFPHEPQPPSLTLINHEQPSPSPGFDCARVFSELRSMTSHWGLGISQGRRVHTTENTTAFHPSSLALLFLQHSLGSTTPSKHCDFHIWFSVLWSPCGIMMPTFVGVKLSWTPYSSP